MNVRRQPQPRWWIALCAVLALVQLGGLVRLATLPPDLLTRSSLIPALEVVAYGGWLAAFCWMAYSLWRRQSSWQAAWVLLLLYAVYHVMRLAVFAQADYDRQRLPVLIVAVALLCLLTLIWFARRWWRKNRLKKG